MKKINSEIQLALQRRHRPTAPEGRNINNSRNLPSLSLHGAPKGRRILRSRNRMKNKIISNERMIRAFPKNQTFLNAKSQRNAKVRKEVFLKIKNKKTLSVPHSNNSTLKQNSSIPQLLNSLCEPLRIFASLR